MKNICLYNQYPPVVSFGIRKGKCRIFILGSILTISFLFLFSGKSLGSIIIKTPTNGENICSNTAANGSAPGYTVLNNIIVQEGVSSDFAFSGSGSNLTLILTAPSGWMFNSSSPVSYTFSGSNITGVSTVSLTATTLTINVAGQNTSGIDNFSIKGLAVEAVSTGSASGDITASSAFGFNGITVNSSSFATLSLQAIVTPSVSIAASPPGTICTGTPVTFTTAPVNGGSSPGYQWELNGTQVATGSTYANSGLSNGDQIYAVMTSNATCISATTANSNTIQIAVNPIATVNPVSNQTFCPGSSTSLVSFSSPTTGGSITYNWTNANSGIGLAASGTGNIGSFTTTNSGSNPISGTITVIPAYTSGGTTCSGTPMNFTLTVNPVVTVNPVSNQTLCAGSNTSAVNFTSPTTGGSITYNWTNSNPAIGLAASGTGNIGSFTATNTGSNAISGTITVTPVYTSGGTTCSGTPITFTLTVNPVVTINPVSNQTFCPGSSTSPIIFGSPTTDGSITYSWTNSNSAIGLAASGTGNIGSFTPNNSGSSPISGTITVIPVYTNGGKTCSGTPITFTLTVNPVAAINTVSNQTICAGSSTNPVSFTSPTTGGSITYNWTNTNSAIGLAASGSGNIASFTATNSGSSTISGTITVIPSYTNGGKTCSGTSSLFTLTVVPLPTANAGTAVALCGYPAQATPTGATSINITTGASATNYAGIIWTSSGTGTFTNATSLTNAVYTPSSADLSAGSVTIKLTATGNAPCTSVSSSKLLTLGKQIINNNIALLSLQYVCGDSTTVRITDGSPAVSGGNGVYSYSWEISPNGASGWTLITGANTDTLRVLTAGTSTFFRRAVYSGGCISNDTTNNSNKIKVSLKQSPPPNNVTGGGHYCSGGSGVIIGVDGTALNASYVLWLGGVNTGTPVDTVTGTGDPISFDLQTAAGTYYVQGVVVNPDGTFCTANMTGSATITIDPAPATPTISAGSSTNLCTGSSVTLSSSATTNNQWYKNGSLISGAVSQTYTTSAAGTYTVLVTNSLGCTATASPTIVSVHPLPTGTISGNQNLCNGSAALSVSLTGTSPWSLTYSNGSTTTTVTGILTSPYIFAVNPTVTTTYTLTALTDAYCTSLPGGLSGSATVTVLSGAHGVWTGAAGDKDWFNCQNWGDGKVPTLADDVLIPGSAATICRIDATISPYAAAFNNIAQCKSLVVDNQTLFFYANSDTLTDAGNLTIQNNGLVDMTNGGKLEIQGNWIDMVSVAGKGFIDGIGKVIFSGGVNQFLRAVGSPETFYNFQINKTSATGLLNLYQNVTVNQDLTLTYGIITTGTNLFTWANSGGLLTAPEPAWTQNSLNYTRSFIATCDSLGTPVTGGASATIPFTGNVGFRINKVSNMDTYFPVGASFLPAGTSITTPAPNRMMINNQYGSPADFTVIVNYGDIGNTVSAAGTYRVNRIWYVKTSAFPPSDTGKANMKLFYTKRDWTQWATGENEVEAGFLYSRGALIEKDYSGIPTNVLRLSDVSADIPGFLSGFSNNTEIYGQYTINNSYAVDGSKNGINSFYRFSIVDTAGVILPVTVINFKAYQTGMPVQIEWTSLEEKNINFYEIESSGNGTDFHILGLIPASNKNLQQETYHFTDQNPLEGMNFYRLKITDKDGKISYTKIISLNTQNIGESVRIFPNPATMHSFLLELKNMGAGIYHLQVYNTIGQLVLTAPLNHSGGTKSYRINLPAGITIGAYNVRLFFGQTPLISKILLVE